MTDKIMFDEPHKRRKTTEISPATVFGIFFCVILSALIGCFLATGEINPVEAEFFLTSASYK